MLFLKRFFCTSQYDIKCCYLIQMMSKPIYLKPKSH